MRIENYYLHSSPEDLDHLTRVLTGRVLSGKSSACLQYETALAKYFGSHFAVAVSSGTAALHTALYLLNVGPDTEVLVPATAPVPSLLPILTLGATPVVVDTNRRNFHFNPEHLGKMISKKSKVALAVPLWGYPDSYESISSILEADAIELVEDAAQCHGARLFGKMVGTVGAFGCFSTHDRKLLSTGEGGFLLTNDEVRYRSAVAFRQIGNLDGVTYGVNFKLGALQCALGLSRLTGLDKQISQRLAKLERLLVALSNIGLLSPSFPTRSCPNGHAAVFQLPDSYPEPVRFRERLHEFVEQDVVKFNMKLAFEHPLLAKRVRMDGAYENARHLLTRTLTFPIHPGVTDAQVGEMSDIVRDLLEPMRIKR
jgi:perosamine synthetase